MIPTGPKLQPDFGLHPIISACNYFSNTSSTICRDAVDLTKPIFVYPEIGFYGLSVVFSVVVIISLWDKIKGSCCESKKINK